MSLIKTNVVPGSTVITDGWAAYCRLKDEGYKHYVVNHRQTFKTECTNQETGETVVVHTNQIEGAWKHAKDYFRHMNKTKVHLRAVKLM